MFLWFLMVGLEPLQAKPLISQFKDKIAKLEEASAKDLKTLRGMAVNLPEGVWVDEKEDLLKMLERNIFLLQLWTKFLNQDSHPLAVSVFHRLTQREGILPVLMKTLERSDSRSEWIQRIKDGPLPFLEKYALFYQVTLYRELPELESVTRIPFCPQVAPFVSKKWILGLIQPQGCLFLHQGFVKQKVRVPEGAGEDLWSLLGKVAKTPTTAILADLSEALGFSWSFPILRPLGPFPVGRYIQRGVPVREVSAGDLVCYASSARRVMGLSCTLFESWMQRAGGSFAGIEPNEYQDAFRIGERLPWQDFRETIFLRLLF
jgi:hypothetical protein